jgi:large subunit ribosomal protein L15
MQIHQISSKTKRAKKVQVGRGGKRGKTSGKGHKGQKARAGRKLRPEMRDIIKKMPKLRGRGKNINKAFALKATAVNLDILNKNFENGQTVSPLTLFQKDIIKKVSGKFSPVKILSVGELDKKLIIKNCQVSALAKTKIEKTGSVIK